MGLSPMATVAGQQPAAQPAMASNPAPAQSAQIQSPNPQASGKTGTPDFAKYFQPAPKQFDPMQINGQQGQTPQMGQPNQYAQTIGMGNNTGSRTASPVGSGKFGSV